MADALTDHKYHWKVEPLRGHKYVARAHETDGATADPRASCGVRCVGLCVGMPRRRV